MCRNQLKLFICTTGTQVNVYLMVHWSVGSYIYLVSDNLEPELGHKEGCSSAHEKKPSGGARQAILRSLIPGQRCFGLISSHQQGIRTACTCSSHCSLTHVGLAWMLYTCTCKLTHLLTVRCTMQCPFSLLVSSVSLVFKRYIYCLLYRLYTSVPTTSNVHVSHSQHWLLHVCLYCGLTECYPHVGSY